MRGAEYLLVDVTSSRALEMLAGNCVACFAAKVQRRFIENVAEVVGLRRCRNPYRLSTQLSKSLGSSSSLRSPGWENLRDSPSGPWILPGTWQSSKWKVRMETIHLLRLAEGALDSKLQLWNSCRHAGHEIVHRVLALVGRSTVPCHWVEWSWSTRSNICKGWSHQLGRDRIQQWWGKCWLSK